MVLESYDPKRGAWLRRSRHHNPLSRDHSEFFEEETEFRLVFEASQSQPDYAKLFLATGGAINTAAGAAGTDFAVTSSTAAIVATLHSSDCKRVTLSLPAESFTLEGGLVKIDNRAKLNISSQRVGAAINGTLVDTHAGAGSVYLANLLRDRDCHTQIPCVYGTLASHTCTVGISNMRVVDKSGEEIDVEFTENKEKETLLKKAEDLVDEWAHNSWDMRQNVVYKLSPALTKSVAKVPVGVNDKGYDLVHNVIDQEYPFSVQSLDSLFEHAMGMELEYDPSEMKQMLAATAAPGMKAAVWAQTVAAACSTAACFLVAYRADGRTVMGATGSIFTSTESWLRTAMRTPCESNDCDGSALLVVAMLQAAVDATDEELSDYPHVRAIKNAVFPYYTYGIAVVAATSAEASAGGGEGDKVAGHALALMIPTIGFMAGMDRAATGGAVGGRKLTTDPRALREARYKAAFPEEVLAKLPEAEASKLRSGNVGDWEQAMRLQAYAIEGTTPASPIVYLSDAGKRAHYAKQAENDMKAFGAAAPNVGRSMKILHVGGRHDADPHRFYHDFVEISLHATHPFYTNAGVRALGAGASQYIFARPAVGASITTAGMTPRQLSEDDYVLVPLHTVDETKGQVLDYAASISKADVIPPRAGPTTLSASQSRDVRRSIAALKQLDAGLSKDETPGHCVAYIFAYSSLVNNPLAIEHFCARVSKVAVAGLIDFRIVEGLAVHPGEGGEQAGHFAVANVVVRV